MEILAAKNRHQQHERQKEQNRAEHEQMVAEHRQMLSRMREERKETMLAAQEQALAHVQEQARTQKELAARSASEIAYMRDVEQEIANFKRNAIRQVWRNDAVLTLTWHSTELPPPPLPGHRVRPWHGNAN